MRISRPAARFINAGMFALPSMAPGGGGGSLPPPATRIWLDTPTLTRLVNKRDGGDSDYLKFKADADNYMSQSVPSFTITGISNAKPAVVTIAETVPWSLGTTGSDEEDVYIAGLTGAWAFVNALGYPPNFGYVTGTHTFEIYNQSINVHYASSAATVEFTLWEAVPWASGTAAIRLTGFQNGWESLNGTWTATKTGTFTFTIPASSIGFPDFHDDSGGANANYYNYITYRGNLLMPVDATTFGSFAGQTPVMFPYNSVQFSYQGGGWFDRAFALGLMYKLLGDSPTAYGTKAVAWLSYMASLGAAGMRQPVSTDSYYATRFTLAAMALITDWCYPLLSSGQKTTIAACVNTWFDLTIANALDIDGPAASNYFTGHLLGLGLVGLATASDNARSAEIVAAVRSRIDTIVTPGVSAGGIYEGGIPYESYGYGTNGWERLLYYYDALRTATAEDLGAGYSQLIRHTIYNLRPDRWRVNDEGDYPGDYTGVLIPSYPITLAHVLSGTPGAWAKYLVDHLAANDGQAVPYMTRLLWYDSGATATDYTATEPVGHISPGDGKLIRRTDWSDLAVWGCVNGGAAVIGGHQAKVAGHVSLQRGADVLMPYLGSWKGTTDGEFGHPIMFTLNGGLGNTLFHYDGHVYNFYSPGDTDQTYFGNQGTWGTTAIDGGKSDALDKWAYQQADLTSAWYNNNPDLTLRTLRTFKRAAIFAGNVLIVFDYVLRGSTSYTDQMRWHFHRLGIVGVSGNTATISGIGPAINVHFASAASTVEFTLWQPVPWSSGTHTIRLTDFANGWEAANGTWTATKTGTNTFTIPLNSLALPDYHTDPSAYATYGGTLSITSSKVFLKAFMPGSTAPSAPTIVANTVKQDFIADTGQVIGQRLIVSDAGTPSTTNRFLTVIHPTAEATSAMPTTTLITETGGTRTGVSFVDGSTTWIVMFSADGSIQESGSFNV